jgi:hypothetical protein
MKGEIITKANPVSYSHSDHVNFLIMRAPLFERPLKVITAFSSDDGKYFRSDEADWDTYSAMLRPNLDMGPCPRTLRRGEFSFNVMGIFQPARRSSNFELYIAHIDDDLGTSFVQFYHRHAKVLHQTLDT